jgi:hypothetical protein
LYYCFGANVAVTDGAGLGDIERLGNLFAVDSVFNRDRLVGEVPDMRFVDEADVVGKTVDQLPVNRLVRLEGRPDFLNLRLGRSGGSVDFLVAKEALLDCWHRCSSALGHVSVTELTLYVVVRNVYGVREGHRLGWGVAEAEWRVGEPRYEQNNDDKAKNYGYDAPGYHQWQHFPAWHHLFNGPVQRFS